MDAIRLWRQIKWGAGILLAIGLIIGVLTDRRPPPASSPDPTETTRENIGKYASWRSSKIYIGQVVDVQGRYYVIENNGVRQERSPGEILLTDYLPQSSQPSVSSPQTPAKPPQSSISSPQPSPKPSSASIPKGASTISKDNMFGATDRKQFEKLVGYLTQNDAEAFSGALAAGVLAGECILFNKGDVVFVTDTAMLSGLIKVRRKGESTEYWTYMEAVK